ncbi:MAG: hypothetical protein HY744_26350 [Deltaproteobacteria bacterium]|nr:hypothetical protein [Deltaproteobacteria bacterium]
MNASRREQAPPSGIAPEDVKKAIGQSGYPLEIRLLQCFQDEEHVTVEFNPLVPSNARDRKESAPDRKEIDLLALFHAWRDRPDGSGGGIDFAASLRVLIEAKGFDDDGAFVGLRSTKIRHEPDWLLRHRCVLAGHPSCDVIPALQEGWHAVWNGPLPGCLDPLAVGGV